MDVIAAAYSLVGKLDISGAVSPQLSVMIRVGEMLRSISGRKPELRYITCIWTGLQRICNMGCNQWLSGSGNAGSCRRWNV